MQTETGREAAPPSHELVTTFDREGLAFDKTLIEMLDEHYSHHTERRGCGFTQASRYLATLVNWPMDKRRERIAKLFPDLRGKVFLATLSSDGNDVDPPHPRLQPLLEVGRSLEREESRLLAALMLDLVFPVAPHVEGEAIPAWPKKLEIGSCPLAEKYFLEIGHRKVRRRGRVNVLVSDRGAPLLIEKLAMGDDHSCVSVAEVVLNGVRLPPGCLFGVERDDGIAVRENASLPGDIIPVSRCSGFQFLRLTTLAVSPENRPRAFSAHFAAQVNAGLFAPGEARIDQLLAVATEQLAGS